MYTKLMNADALLFLKHAPGRFKLNFSFLIFKLQFCNFLKLEPNLKGMNLLRGHNRILKLQSGKVEWDIVKIVLIHLHCSSSGRTTCSPQSAVGELE